ncbi:hypothetical protein [Sphingomonas glacialis]|uniref:Uncharacterized protein n=1 Tax=Sphingomonas glacialis TaxID=658225 RepID=A0A502G5W1_9SPHN|nr:hypothetical protein [Sphingomonas glacialis]TPG56586.1 hypothetical protein EAH76_03385 [Sphingomonas glacialis]
MMISDRRILNGMADEMLGEARATGFERVYSATGFSQQNISIVHQQVRCANLAWALHKRRKLGKGDVVAIIGGSFSGLMLACSLAVASDVIVYIVEKERRLLDRFLDKSQRYLSPHLNSRDLRKSFSPTYARPMYDPAIFDWQPGTASEVAWAWLTEFDRYYAKLPIFTLLGCAVEAGSIAERDHEVVVQLSHEGGVELKPLVVDVVIDATGFGPESNPMNLADHSYWEGGHRLIYDHLPPESRVLVSGCGDSGIIELMHYALADFHHGMVERFWPAKIGLERLLDEGLERINDVLRSKEVERYDYTLMSELCWWLDRTGELMTWRKENWDDFPPPRSTPAIYHAIDTQMSARLKVAFPRRDRRSLTWDDLEAFALAMPFDEQLAVRDAVATVIDDAISEEIALLMEQVKVEEILDHQVLRNMMRPGTKVTLNGLTPTPFTRQLSAYNIWLTHVMMSLPNVRYRRGRIADSEQQPDGRYQVAFADGATEIFERFVSRYGPGQWGDSALLKGDPRDRYLGDFLLGHPTYSTATDKPNIWKTVVASSERVTKYLKSVQRRVGVDRQHPLHKQSYLAGLIGIEPNSWTTEQRYLDPQNHLSEQIRAGHRPAYCERLRSR